ncbi:PTS sugar transporter subunit IIA [Rhodoferax sp. AJA081-3]|uniref:PTS sugar transporter subunit IIA n=1 Tax=Rhodoferax sp. AJA081-3 TaxID=2752316 RepID=UPI001ADFDCBC|nr:PTS sugar transporter subunit IIA [Rhodoferax sp. AJA081-3]QTN26214.1 PTS sugar transporter subunit IIA [Rhodoferax sp. AJA081-3]
MNDGLLMKDILCRERVLLDAPVTSQAEAFAAIGQVVQSCSLAKAAEVAYRLSTRERHGSTAMGYGVAIPHAQISGLRRPLVVFLRPKTPIPFQTPDGNLVTDLLVLLVPKPAVAQHFALLSDFIQLLSDPDFRQALVACVDTLEVWQLFEQWPFYKGVTKSRPPVNGVSGSRMQQCDATS